MSDSMANDGAADVAHRPASLTLVPLADDKLSTKDFKSDQEVRWCPGCGDYAILAAFQSFLPELGDPAREPGLHLRHRLLVPVAVLRGHLRHALDPRPRPGDRHRPGRHPARPVGLGDHRRRRRAVDRRQPPDPRAAPQREHQDPAVQQPDLRADQGPVLADLRAGQGHQVDAVRARWTTRSTRCRWRSAPRPPSWPARSTPTAST